MKGDIEHRPNMSVIVKHKGAFRVVCHDASGRYRASPNLGCLKRPKVEPSLGMKKFELVEWQLWSSATPARLKSTPELQGHKAFINRYVEGPSCVVQVFYSWD